MNTLLQHALRFALPLVWGCGIVASLWSLERYNSLGNRVEATGPLVVAPATDALAAGRRLVMYVHPHCPCTRASLAAMAQLLADEREPLAAEIVVVVASGMDSDWRQGVIVRAAEALARDATPSVTVRFDLAAAEARAVGAQTSGHTLLFAADGTLLFRGGITRSRGHEGDSVGSRSVAALLHDHKPEAATTPVFGCPLYQAEPCAAATACPVSNSIPVSSLDATK